MWDLGNRGAVVLISVTFGCVLVYNAWGAVLALAFTLLLVVYACYSLLANDSLVSPHAYHVLGYLREAVRELGAALRAVHGHGTGYARKLWHSASRCYRERFPPFRMDRRRASSYQLSSDSYAAAVRRGEPPSLPLLSSSSSSRFGLIGQLSPIPCDPYRSRVVNDTLGADGELCHAGDYDRASQRQQYPVYAKHTSTPVLRPGGREDCPRNGDLVSRSRETPARRIPPVHAQNHTLSRGENVTQFSPEGSPWGMSISPKMRPRPAGVKTVQTVAGPLLASTRYNIDPKLYTDVSSPGLTTRLTKYATEAKNKLTHQSQYGTGQFPKVNLHANPIPLLNSKLTKLRMPVTVRVAPPDVTKYSPPERQKMLSHVCHTENRSPTSVVQVLREISLKRHASTEDVSFDVAKKQRTEFFNEERETIVEENKQKRNRDELSKSDEDLSPQSKSVRPAKRTKTRSCYDILNSLSSSAHVAAGVKRKADFSRSGTPDFEKHFKSLESARTSSSPTVPQSRPKNLDLDDGRSDFREMYTKGPEVLSSKKTEEFPLVKGILKSSNKESRLNLDKTGPAVRKSARSPSETDNNKSAVPRPVVKLTDKLFMRAEPERNEQLKSLVEEPGNVKVKFATDNVEEIRKEDIRNMRQNSMKARLQSMFDAISGKAENKINPDVVIQADDINTITPPVTQPVSCATLNSSTMTTSINTTPLSTAAIVPSGFSSSRPSIEAKLETKSDAALPNTTSPAQLSVPATNTLVTKDTNLAAKTIGTIEQTKAVSIAPAVTSKKPLETIISSTPSIATPTFAFGKPATDVPAVTSKSTLPNFSTGTYSSSTFTPISSKSTNFLVVDKAPSSSTFAPISPTTTQGNVQANKILTSAVITSPSTGNTQTALALTFGSNKPALPVAMPTQVAASSLPSQLPGAIVALLPTNATTATSVAGFNKIVNSSAPSGVTTASATAPLFAFGSNSAALQSPKSDKFMFGQPSSNAQPKTNAFASPANSQAASLSQVTTKPFNFSSTPIASLTTVANSSFTANMTTTTASTFGLSSPSTFSLATTSATASIPTLSTSKPLFVFGASNASSATPIALPAGTSTTTTTTVPQFGTSTTAVAQFGTPTTAVSQFGTPTTAVSQFGTPTTTVSQFGTPPMAVSQFRTPATTVSQFGAPTTSIFATASVTTNASIFGTASNSQPLFGTASGSGAAPEAASLFNAPKTTTSAIFVSTTNVAPSSGGTSLFSNAGANSTPTTAAPSVFGSSAPVFGQASKSTASFGAASGMFGSTTAPMFGRTTQTSTTAPAFGVAGNVSTSAITPGTTFGTTNSTTPAFGTPGAGTATSVQAAPAFGSTTGIFGSTDSSAPSVPIFGANAAPATGDTFGISSPPSNFGTQNSPSLAFGAAVAGTAFGDNKSLFGATPATSASFGASSPPVPAFGAGSANNAAGATNNMFVFGGAQKDGQQSTTSPFGSNFNAASNNSTAALPVPFQFGSSSKPATAGFNFTAPPATPTLNFGTTVAPTFNPSTPGMFSIGSGSTAPRSRTIRSRKPR
ncbi:PREDICTED: mucin-19 isoform X2 [Vollenhovia emeryi]|uniref:mucin-19 isoform X2 n=1 Tax=Vollenhovia emeryi TaxID=411798 RepID=UPI0005F5006E|nr:PREDICTED: mucin-19 isoform X2 [Vollenhovia emeryi]